MSQTETDPKDNGLRLRARLRYLYHGSQPPAVRFRLMVIVIDLAIIGFFLAAPILKNMGWAFYALDYFIAAILALDWQPADGDLVVVASKIVAKAEGRYVPVADRDAAAASVPVPAVAEAPAGTATEERLAQLLARLDAALGEQTPAL